MITTFIAKIFYIGTWKYAIYVYKEFKIKILYISVTILSKLIGWFRYEFPLEEMDGHMVEINMYDKDHTSKDEFLGYAAIDVRNFMQQSSLLAGVGGLS